MPNIDFEILEARWEDDVRSALLAIRIAVFVVEQGVPEDMEVDDEDPASRHFLAVKGDGATPIGTVRLTPKGKITRLAVDKAQRGQGVGRALLARAIDEAEAAGPRRLYLHAQTHAAGFYEAYGFVAEGEVFDEAGIPHQKMVRDPSSSPEDE